MFRLLRNEEDWEERDDPRAKIYKQEGCKEFR